MAYNLQERAYRAEATVTGLLVIRVALSGAVVTWDALSGRGLKLQIRFLVSQLLVYPKGN